MPELTPQQMAVLERLVAHGFHFAAFPLYANHIGIRKGNCAVLLAPEPGGFQLYGEPCYLVGGNLSVKLTQGGHEWFVWKKTKLEATAERQGELRQFAAELGAALNPAG